MIRTYKCKLNLTKAQADRLCSWVGASRVVYNLGLEIKIASYKATGKSITEFDLIKQITPLRKEVEWINDVPYDILAQAIRRLQKSYNNFFRDIKKGVGKPQFANKKKYKSIEVRKVRIKENAVKIQTLGWLKMFKDENIIGTPVTSTIKIEPTGIFICIQCEDAPKRFESDSQAIGLDMGISHFCIDSNGNFISNPKHFKKHERKLRIENRSLSRKKQGSNSWKKQAQKLSKLHNKIGNIRRDFLHKESTKIANL